MWQIVLAVVAILALAYHFWPTPGWKKLVNLINAHNEWTLSTDPGVKITISGVTIESQRGKALGGLVVHDGAASKVLSWPQVDDNTISMGGLGDMYGKLLQGSFTISYVDDKSILITSSNRVMKFVL